jgi:hypothetical protein
MVNQDDLRRAGNSAGIAELLRDLFVSTIEICPAEAYRALKNKARKTSYPAILRLFYDLRQLSLIEFTHEEKGNTPIDIRYHRIIPGKEDDVRWKTNPHHLLYPSSAIGGLNYREGMSRGRDKKYAKGDKIPDSGRGKPVRGSLRKTGRQASD